MEYNYVDSRWIGRTMKSSTVPAVKAGALGKIYSGRPDPQVIWDTDKKPQWEKR